MGTTARLDYCGIRKCVVDVVIFHEERNTGWKTIAEGYTRIFFLCDLYWNCMMNR